jgi:hypothetical protein
MPKNKDLKRRVRTRMSKTGESYTAARSRVVGRDTHRVVGRDTHRVVGRDTHRVVGRDTHRVVGRDTHGALDTRDLADIAGMSNAAVKAKTGRTWRQWVAVLDKAGAAKKQHPEIARHLAEVHELSGWWSQTVTVSYERIRGLREKGQGRDGIYVVNKSKTYPVPVAELYRAFSARGRKHWLGAISLRVKSASVDKSMRITWEDGTSVNAYFTAKDSSKSQVQIQHRDLAKKSEVARVRADWTNRLASLGRFLA